MRFLNEVKRFKDTMSTWFKVVAGVDEVDELNLGVQRSMYQKTFRLGSARITIDEDIYLMLWAQQFRPMRYNGTLYLNSYCAYRGLGAPLTMKYSTGLPPARNGFLSNLDHVIPLNANGPDHPFNYQLLASWYNSTNFKGGLATFHSRWHAFRQGGDIDGLPFEEITDLFFWLFDHYHESPHLRYIIQYDLCFAWPWWAREENPPHRPILHGYDEGRKIMVESKETSYGQEFSMLAQNVLNYFKCLGKGRASYEQIVRGAYVRYYKMEPESMAIMGRKSRLLN